MSKVRDWLKNKKTAKVYAVDKKYISNIRHRKVANGRMESGKEYKIQILTCNNLPLL